MADSHVVASENFRDSVATIGEHGRRVWLYPNKPRGKYFRARTYLSFALLAILFGMPFLKIDGRPVLMLNILERKFFIFGLTFWPQDFYIFVLVAIAFLVFVLLFTAILGRLFCGWICPQTVFMEMVFRKIEYLIEGNSTQRRKLDAQEMNVSKFSKKALKHIVFFGLAFVIANTFLAYIIGIDSLTHIVSRSPAEHMAGFIAIVLFSGAFYWVFAWFREQACTMVCPYGRLQSVLLDSNSLIVAYDYNRGEPRRKYIEDKTREISGHCIDCRSCVKVCPTGIDIRNGTQLECVHCTACMDACDRVMKGVKLPTGLIRYTSQDILEKGRAFHLTPRIAGYGTLFIMLTSLVIFLIAARSDVETTILRTPGTLYQETDQGQIMNLYNYTVINKTFNEMPVEFRLKSSQGEIRMVGGPIDLAADGLAEGAFFVTFPKDKLYSENTLITIDVLSNGKQLEEVRTSFNGPGPKK